MYIYIYIAPIEHIRPRTRQLPARPLPLEPLLPALGRGQNGRRPVHGAANANPGQSFIQVPIGVVLLVWGGMLKLSAPPGLRPTKIQPKNRSRMFSNKSQHFINLFRAMQEKGHRAYLIVAWWRPGPSNDRGI